MPKYYPFFFFDLNGRYKGMVPLNSENSGFEATVCQKMEVIEHFLQKMRNFLWNEDAINLVHGAKLWNRETVENVLLNRG